MYVCVLGVRSGQGETTLTVCLCIKSAFRSRYNDVNGVLCIRSGIRSGQVWLNYRKWVSLLVNDYTNMHIIGSVICEVHRCCFPPYIDCDV